MVNAAIAAVEGDLLAWGYTRKGNATALRAAFSEAMLAQRSPRLADLAPATLAKLHGEADARITRRGLVLLSYLLVPGGPGGGARRRKGIRCSFAFMAIRMRPNGVSSR